MNRRKGELSAPQIDRGWPHQVIVPDLGERIDWGRWPSLCPRSHSVVVDGAWHRILYFADEADAMNCYAALAPFGAERFDPRRRQRGSKWATLKPS